MNDMNELGKVLDDCLQEMQGGSTLEQCLRRHPGQAMDLKPMLEAAVGLGRGRQVTPSPAFKKRARRALSDYWQSHPQRRTWPAPLAMRLTAAIAAVFVVLMLAGTAYAQSTLPGQPLYDWKIASEKAWRAVAPNPVQVDLSIASRRADELTVVAQQPDQPGQRGREAQAIRDYQQSLQQLQTDSNASNAGQIMQLLESHKKQFSAAGIDDPQLDAILHGNGNGSGGSGNNSGGGGGNSGGGGGGNGGGKP